MSPRERGLHCFSFPRPPRGSSKRSAARCTNSRSLGRRLESRSWSPEPLRAPSPASFLPSSSLRIQQAFRSSLGGARGPWVDGSSPGAGALAASVTRPFFFPSLVLLEDPASVPQFTRWSSRSLGRRLESRSWSQPTAEARTASAGLAEDARDASGGEGRSATAASAGTGGGSFPHRGGQGAGAAARLCRASRRSRPASSEARAGGGGPRQRSLQPFRGTYSARRIPRPRGRTRRWPKSSWQHARWRCARSDERPRRAPSWSDSSALHRVPHICPRFAARVRARGAADRLRPHFSFCHVEFS